MREWLGTYYLFFKLYKKGMLCIVCMVEIMYFARTRIFDFASEAVVTYGTAIFKYPCVLIDDRILFLVQSLATTSEMKLNIYFVNLWLNRP